MSSEVNWPRVRLGDISSKPQYGYTTKSGNSGDVKYLRTTDLTSGKVDWMMVPFCIDNPDDVSKYQLENDDIVISRAGSVGFHSLIKNPPKNSVFASYLIRFKPSEKVNPQYLSHFLNSKDYWNQITDKSAGVAVQNVNAKKLADLTLPLAPKEDQKRIADKLDSVLAKVEAAQARLDKIPTMLKRFRQSVLAAATSGELCEMNIDVWQQEKLIDLLDVMADCPHSTPKWTEAGKVCVRTTQFERFKLKVEESKFVSEETFLARNKRHTPEAGDILYSREGAILGIACQVPEGVDLCLGQRMIVMRPNSRVNAKFLTLVLNAPLITDYIKTITIGNAAPRVNMGTIKQFLIPVPSIKEQEQIINKAELLFEHANTVEKQYNAAKARLDKLTQSILAKAFRGELTK